MEQTGRRIFSKLTAAIFIIVAVHDAVADLRWWNTQTISTHVVAWNLTRFALTSTGFVELRPHSLSVKNWSYSHSAVRRK